MIAMGLTELAHAIGARLVGADRRFHGLACDSRKLENGQLFVALRGERVDGHDFVTDAARRGAAGAVVERAIDVSLPQLVVANSVQALAEIARTWRARCPARVIGITGSNGKTTLKTLTHAILSRVGVCHVNPGNLNNEIGLPLSLCALTTNAEFAIAEMGAGKPGDIAELARIAAPRIGVVNNVGDAHLERLLSRRGIAETKGVIYSALPSDGVAVLNAEDDFFEYFRGLAGKRAQITFALDRAADVRGRILEGDLNAQRLRIETRAGAIDVVLPLPGRHNALNALAATALALAAGATLVQVRQGLETVSAVAGRLTRIPLAIGATLIDDSYNANPDSMRAAIDTLRVQPGSRWLVVGDMKELGRETDLLHYRVGVHAREQGIDRLYAVGELSRHVCAGFGDGARHFDSQQSLIEVVCAELEAGVTVLVKGSRSSAMDRVVQAIVARSSATGTAPGGRHAP